MELESIDLTGARCAAIDLVSREVRLRLVTRGLEWLLLRYTDADLFGSPSATVTGQLLDPGTEIAASRLKVTRDGRREQRFRLRPRGAFGVRFAGALLVRTPGTARDYARNWPELTDSDVEVAYPFGPGAGVLTWAGRRYRYEELGGTEGLCNLVELSEQEWSAEDARHAEFLRQVATYPEHGRAAAGRLRDRYHGRWLDGPPPLGTRVVARWLRTQSQRPADPAA